MANLSFIPKREPQFEPQSGQKLGLPGVFAFVLFLISLLIFGALYFYGRGVKTNINKMTQEVEKQKEEFDPALINELIYVSKNIEAAKIVVREHQVISPVFALLEENALPQTYFQKFGKNKNSVSLEGEAQNYLEILKQVLILKTNPLVQEIKFSKLAKGGANKISFTLEIILKPEISSFKP